MKQIPGLDASFLHLETAQMPMHVGALHEFELPARYRGDFVQDLRRHMADRLEALPALRRKLQSMPLNLSNPVWVDAEPDLTQHIIAVHLPRGSTRDELHRQVGLLHPVLLQRSRPLWKFHVFVGLANAADGARRYAMYTQLHHAAVDGQAAVALGQVILDLTPAGRVRGATAHAVVRAEFGVARLLRGALGHQLSLAVDAVQALPGAVGSISQLAASALGEASGGTWAALAQRWGAARAGPARRVGALALAPRTRLNVTVSAERAFTAVSLPLSRLNLARRRHGATLNDAVLMVCSGALRALFLRHGPLPRKSLVAGVPISTRAQGDAASNNQATMTLVSLGTHLGDPAERWQHVRQATAAMKGQIGALKSLMPTDFPSVGVPWLMHGLSAIAGRARLAERLPALANVTISNVPGPTVPLYMAGAKMLTNHPTSIVVHGVALNITVQTYNDSLEFGLMACARALPEVAELGELVREAFEEFDALPVLDGSPAVSTSGAPPCRSPARRRGPDAATQTATQTAPRTAPRAGSASGSKTAAKAIAPSASGAGGAASAPVPPRARAASGATPPKDAGPATGQGAARPVRTAAARKATDRGSRK